MTSQFEASNTQYNTQATWGQSGEGGVKVLNGTISKFCQNAGNIDKCNVSIVTWLTWSDHSTRSSLWPMTGNIIILPHGLQPRENFATACLA